MRLLFSLLLLTTFLLASCTQSSPEPIPTQTATTEPSKPTPTLLPATPTASLPENSSFTSQPGASLPIGRPMIAYQTGSAQNRILLLADPIESGIYQFSFPDATSFATPFLAGLSPDARYFVYFEGGWLETLYDHKYLRASTPDVSLHVLDLPSGEVIFSVPLLSPSYPQDLEPVAETIKDEWNFTSQNATIEEVVAATQEMLLDNMRKVAWSPDSSLLAYASQDPGPTSDLYFFSPENGTAQRVTTDPGHVIRTVWAPDSSALLLVTSLFDQHAREDTNYLLTREGSLLTSFTSQIWYFHSWHSSTYALFYGATDSGDMFDPQVVSSIDGTTTMLWEGSYSSIAFTPDLSTFLLSSSMPSAPAPPRPGLYLGKTEDGSLATLSESMTWGVVFWGSERFAFAASSLDEGTTGITTEGEQVKIDDRNWRLSASPDGRYLAGYHNDSRSSVAEIVPGLRVFGSDGTLLVSIEDINVLCVGWSAPSTALAFQVENHLYLWDAATGSIRLISDQLNAETCEFIWVQETP